VLVLEGGGERVRQSLFDFAPELRNVSRHGSVLEADGVPPAWIFLDVPEHLRSGSFKLHLQGFVDCFPQWLTGLTALPEVAALERRLADEGDSRALEQLRVLRSHALAKSFVGLEWSTVDEPSARGSVRGTLAGPLGEPSYFDLDVEVGRPAPLLRVDLPPVVGAVFTVHRVEVVVDGETHSVELGAIEAHGARATAPGFTIDAPPAHLSIAVPAQLGPVQTARVRGVVR
jgi:hypothetical protein